MAIEVTSIAEAIEDNGLKILIYSFAGAGKTVACATTGKPTIIISAEGGLLSIKNAPKHIKTIKITCIEDLEEAYELFADSDGPICDWIGIDSISEIAEVILGDEKKSSKDPRQAYGALADRMMDLLRAFRDIPNYNICMTAKQARIEDQDTGRTMYFPSMPGKNLTYGISYLFDEVFALRVETDKEGNKERVFQTDRDAQYDCKDRSGELEMFEPVSLKHIEMKIRGDSYVPYEKKVAEIEPVEEVEPVEVVDSEEIEDPIDPDEDVFIEEELIETGETETAESE